MIPKLKLEIAKYEGLVTVFALILAVEYASGSYDLWDIFIGLLSVYLGSLYWQKSEEQHDFLYSLLIASLIGLGIVTLIFGGFFVVATGVFGFEQNSSPIETFWLENARFVIFGIITLWFYFKLKHRRAHNKSVQPTANAVAD